MLMKKKILSCIIAVVMLLFASAVAYAKTDDELKASNEIEFFVTEADGSWWSVTYPANGIVGNKYLNEVIEGVQLSGIRIDKVSEFRYQLIPETQEQIDMLCGYETVDDEMYGLTGVRQRHKLQAFLRDVYSPTANERIQSEKKQAEIEAKNRIVEAEKARLRNKSIESWNSIINSYIYDNSDNTFNILNFNNSEITVSTYNKSDFSLIDTKNIPLELDIFGGFFSGKKYNYIVFGQKNMEEDNSKEIVRIVKYDKYFTRLSSVSVSDCYTTEPFAFSSLRMAEHDDTLTIHTSRQRYLTDDGARHQSELTIILDTEKMKVKNYVGEWQENHVSHSLNQFVQYDGDTFVLIDHGDAYPRSIVLHKYEGINPEEWLTEYYDRTLLKYTTVDLFNIPGAVGANYTGVTVGGFECSDTNYLVAINTIDHSKITEYVSHNLDERDIVILVSGKNNTKSSAVKNIYLTDYVGKNKLGSKPYLVKLSDNRFLVLWQEFEYNGSTWNDNGMKYVQLNGNGEIISDIRTDTSLLLSSDCQPTLIDNNLIWYIDLQDERKFYNMDLNKSLITVTVNEKIIDFDQPPTIIDGRTLVPLRAIFEALGATVDWNGDTQTVTSKQGKTTITLTINDNKMYKDGKAITLDVPAQMMNDRTLVPVRAVAEAFGCDVDWDSETQQVIITE